MGKGWISIHRQLRDNWMWSDKPFAKGQAWIDLLLRATHSKQSACVCNQIIEIEKGQILTSIKALSEDWGWSRKKVANLLQTLTKRGKTHIKSTSKYTLITIVKWGDFQDSWETKEQQKDITGTSEEHQKSIKSTHTIMSYNESNAIMQDNVEDVGCSVSKKPSQPKRRGPLLVDDEFIETLQNNPAYVCHDVRNEYHKMQAWLLTPRGTGKTMTRQRFINWLNRADPTKQMQKPKTEPEDFTIWDEAVKEARAERERRRNAL